MQNLTLPDAKFFEPAAPEPVLDDWSETTQEMLDTVPQTWSRSVLYCIVAFGAIAIPWAMLAKVDEVGVARGRLEPRGKTLRLDATTSGTVAAVKVKEGQQVKRGDRILELNADLIKAELQQTQARLDGLVNRYAQLEGLRSHVEVSIRTQQQQLRSQELEQVAQMGQIRQRVGFYQNSANLSQAVLSKDQSKAARYRKFREQGIVAGVQVEDAERAEIESQQRVEQARSEIAQTLAELQKQQSTYQKILRQSELTILDSTKQIKELDTQISDLRSEIKQTQNQLRSLQFQWKQRVIQVPVEGTIFQLPIQNAGAVVQTGQNVAQIAPKGAPLVLRAQMSSDQSGFLRVGLPVKVKFDAYPFQDYGIVQGYIRWISPDSRKVEQSPQAQQQEVFDVEIQLEKNQIQAGGKAVPLTAGQTATAEVIIRQRHLIDFMLDPFRKLQNSGMNI